MNKQQIIDELKNRGQSDPFKNVKILLGEDLLLTSYYLEAAIIKGHYVQPENYYVFLFDKGSIHEFRSAEEAAESAMQNAGFDFSIIEAGDYVDFGHLGSFYICGENISRDKFLISVKEPQSYENPEETFYIEKEFAQGIINKKGA
ncbi:hypothetical protein OXPF_06750 [Oxobacter pfennigii]|uniref:Uncharacterized protein n=1 Tax=Oxobacter pfennigii TaxID=36849 RepID=A0A0P8W9Z9_9CLOT|nr:hypothetical protein [Oxobacter pfennigii]KPU45442.1 hypothetical protein OXPF_06750 [Oxobacter pfennigii]